MLFLIFIILFFQLLIPQDNLLIKSWDKDSVYLELYQVKDYSNNDSLLGGNTHKNKHYYSSKYSVRSGSKKAILSDRTFTLRKYKVISSLKIYDKTLDDNGNLFEKINFRNEFVGFEPSFYLDFNLIGLDTTLNSTVFIRILDAVERNIKEVKIPLKKPKNIVPISIKYDLSNIPTGSYYLEVTVLQDGNLIDRISESVFILSEQKPLLVTNFTEDERYEKSLYKTLSEDDVDNEIKQLKFIVNDLQQEQFELLTSYEAKRRGLFKYWLGQDIDDDEFINKKRQDFEKAIKHANVNFSYGSTQKNGWNSDRGRILLKYGFPMEINNFTQRGDLKACEIWFIRNINGGSYFYFVDVGGYNNYILVHSTLRTETQNELWIEQYNPAIDDDAMIRRDDQLLETQNR